MPSGLQEAATPSAMLGLCKYTSCVVKERRPRAPSTPVCCAFHAIWLCVCVAFLLRESAAKKPAAKKAGSDDDSEDDQPLSKRAPAGASKRGPSEAKPSAKPAAKPAPKPAAVGADSDDDKPLAELKGPKGAAAGAGPSKAAQGADGAGTK
eukprot:scaffold224057_cov19-Tisochrysis_lutea.AAC.1